MAIERNIPINISPIGVIHSPFTSTNGVPIQPAFAQGYEGTVEVYKEFEEALLDLEGFERIWLLFWLDRASKFKLKVRPYLDDKLHGLFTTRAPSRPNPIGLSCVKLLSVEKNILRICEIDILDGTPLLDIKPYVGKFDCFDVKRNGWLDTVSKGNTKADNRFYNDKNMTGDKK
ncbi:MAG: tRNA (N6-threonylcarbamoyladenosine(37)-N6)-methyltransferase TrmO [Phycisphaerales bacterium]|jgi:tRNA-Thr(GGU) m(6)t(6)A37 methyltransferase TsaA